MLTGYLNYWFSVQGIKKIIELFEQNKYDIRFVGGCVRDALLNNKSSEIDFAINCEPNTIVQLLKENNIATISDKNIRNGDGIKQLKDTVSTFDSLYVSVDLDVLDPAFAPGVGNPEAVGISSRELYDLIISLQNKKIIAADIVELNPSFDNGSTASMAAKLISTIIAMNLNR